LIFLKKYGKKEKVVFLIFQTETNGQTKKEGIMATMNFSNEEELKDAGRDIIQMMLNRETNIPVIGEENLNELVDIQELIAETEDTLGIELKPEQNGGLPRTIEDYETLLVSCFFSTVSSS